MTDLNELSRSISKMSDLLNDSGLAQSMNAIKNVTETLNNSAFVETIQKVTSVFSKTIFSESFYKLIESERKRINELKDLDYDAYKCYFQEKINNATELGKYGWTLSPNACLSEESEIVKKLQKNKTEKSCVKYFFENKDIVLSEIEKLKKIYEQKSNLQLYFGEFEKHFNRRDYMASAFFISGVLENRMKYAFKDTDIKKYKAIIKKGIENKRNCYFNKAKENGNYYTSIFIITEFLPSFQEYAKRTFTEEEGTHIDKQENEPHYFNRNWLCHGVRTRKVERYEILQIINALSCLEAIIDAFKDYKIL